MKALIQKSNAPKISTNRFGDVVESEASVMVDLPSSNMLPSFVSCGKGKGWWVDNAPDTFPHLLAGPNYKRVFLRGEPKLQNDLGVLQLDLHPVVRHEVLSLRLSRDAKARAVPEGSRWKAISPIYIAKTRTSESGRYADEVNACGAQNKPNISEQYMDVEFAQSAATGLWTITELETRWGDEK